MIPPLGDVIPVQARRERCQNRKCTWLSNWSHNCVAQGYLAIVGRDITLATHLGPEDSKWVPLCDECARAWESEETTLACTGYHFKPGDVVSIDMASGQSLTATITGKRGKPFAVPALARTGT